MEQLRDRFGAVLANFVSSPGVARLASGDLNVAQYRSYMKQVYFYVRENPQLQALSTIYFRGRQRDLVRSFYKHAVSEIGHEQLALNDYVTCGGDATDVPYQNPLPATTALTAYAFYQIYNLNPLGYLGYLFFLEFLPTQAGGAMSEQFKAVGVPENALTFLSDHIEVDQEHNRLMERYVKQLVKTEADLDCIDYAMKTTGYLYAQMVEASIADVEKPFDTGWNWEELNADGHMPGLAQTASVA